MKSLADKLNLQIHQHLVFRLQETAAAHSRLLDWAPDDFSSRLNLLLRVQVNSRLLEGLEEDLRHARPR